MSRMAAALLLTALAMPARADVIETYLDKTSAEPRCKVATDGEILVCGRREADRHRVPLILPTPGDPKIVDVPAERARLIATEAPCQQMGPYLVGCGAVGVTVSTKIGTGRIETRPLAR